MRVIMSDQRAGQREAMDDGARVLYAAGRERLGVVVADLFLSPRLRLTEWHRVTMASLLERLVRSLEDELRAGLAASFAAADYPELHAALISAHVEIAVPILPPSGALRDPELVMLMFRRVEEHRLRRASNSGPGSDSLIAELVRDDDPAVADAAMAVLIAQSRRLDRFQEPVVTSSDLPAELAHRLSWTIAAALRSYMIDRQGIAPRQADQALARAAMRQLTAHDEADSLEARCLRLAQPLDALGRLDGHLVARSLTEAGLSLFLAFVSLCCKLDMNAAWEIVSEPTGRGTPLLLRAAGLDRNDAGNILLALAGTAGGDAELLARQMNVFDAISQADARATIDFWQLDPVYRAAIATVSTSAGELRAA